MSRNIEIKARCSKLVEAESVIRRIGAVPISTERQRDTYFHCSSGRLKLRQRWIEGKTGEQAELISYEREDTARPRHSDYTLVPIEHGEQLRSLLRAALGVTVEVVKYRKVYLYHQVRIHLDEVEKLGSFIELEAMVDASCDDEQAKAKVEWLCRTLEITGEQVVPVSYSDQMRALT